jgi:SAM-dependent methyltransferase
MDASTSGALRPLEPSYRPDLARVHHLGFAAHADECAPGIIELLRPIRERDGLVVEIGCGSGLLTRRLVDAGHRVVATDASPAMLALAREVVADGAEIRRLTLPGDPVPEADAIVGVGHALNYLPDLASIERALASLARALRPGGVIALDICDLEWGVQRRDARPFGKVGEDWAIVTETSLPTPDRYVRQMAVFVRNPDGGWRRDDERHDNILVDTSRLPRLLAPFGIEAVVGSSFGAEVLPAGLRTVIGWRVTE